MRKNPLYSIHTQTCREVALPHKMSQELKEANMHQRIAKKTALLAAFFRAYQLP